MGEPEEDEFVCDFKSALQHVTGMPWYMDTVSFAANYGHKHLFCSDVRSGACLPHADVPAIPPVCFGIPCRFESAKLAGRFLIVNC